MSYGWRPSPEPTRAHPYQRSSSERHADRCFPGDPRTSRARLSFVTGAARDGVIAADLRCQRAQLKPPLATPAYSGSSCTSTDLSAACHVQHRVRSTYPQSAVAASPLDQHAALSYGGDATPPGWAVAGSSVAGQESEPPGDSEAPTPEGRSRSEGFEAQEEWFEFGPQSGSVGRMRWPSLSGLVMVRTVWTRSSAISRDTTATGCPSGSRYSAPGWPLTSA